MLLTHIRWKPVILGGIAVLYADGFRRRRGLAAQVSERFVGKYGRRLGTFRRADRIENAASISPNTEELS